MIIISLKTESAAGRKPKDSDIGRIELSDGSLFSFRICYLPPEVNPAEMSEGNNINAVQEEGFRFASACLRAEKAALRLIARAEQCTQGLLHKLKRRNHDKSCVNAVISRLCALNLINDRRYAGLWIESRLKFSRTPRRLLSSLCTRGIDHDDAEAALKIALDEEEELAMLLRYVKRHPFKADKKTKNDSAYSFKYRLKSEGFSSQIINRFYDEQNP